MRFVLQLNGSLATPQLRFQKDGLLRKLDHDISLHESDFTTELASDIARVKMDKSTLVFEGVTYKLCEVFHTCPGELELKYTSLVFRREFPAVPNKHQLVEAIRDADESQNSILVLEVDGRFALRKSPPWDATLMPLLWSQRFTRRASPPSESSISGLYVSALEHWIDHLRNHKTQDLSDGSSITGQNENQLIAELRLIAASWKGDY